jgi:hypothetical protein
MKSLCTSLASVVLAISLLATSLAFADAIQPISGAPVQTKMLTSGVTTNTTSALVKNIPNGAKTFFGEVVCSSGTCTQTQAIFGTLYSTAINGVLLCTITLSATTRAQDGCASTMAAYPNVYVTTTNTTGTAATGAIYVLY